jgi:hypothetical protein
MFCERANNIPNNMAFPACHAESGMNSLALFHIGQPNLVHGLFEHSAALCVPTRPFKFVGCSQATTPRVPNDAIISDLNFSSSHQARANIPQRREFSNQTMFFHSTEFDCVSNRPFSQFSQAQEVSAQGTCNQTFLQNCPPLTYALRLQDNLASGQEKYRDDAPVRGRNCPPKKTWKVILTPELAATIYTFKPSENEKKSSSVRLSRRLVFCLFCHCHRIRSMLTANGVLSGTGSARKPSATYGTEPLGRRRRGTCGPSPTPRDPRRRRHPTQATGPSVRIRAARARLARPMAPPCRRRPRMPTARAPLAGRRARNPSRAGQTPSRYGRSASSRELAPRRSRRRRLGCASAAASAAAYAVASDAAAAATGRSLRTTGLPWHPVSRHCYAPFPSFAARPQGRAGRPRPPPLCVPASAQS